MALAFGPGDARRHDCHPPFGPALPRYNPSSAVIISYKTARAWAWSSTPSTLFPRGLNSPRGRVSLLSHIHSSDSPTTACCQVAFPDPQGGKLECGSFITSRWAKKIRRKGDPVSQGVWYVVQVRAYLHARRTQYPVHPARLFLNFSTRSLRLIIDHRYYCINKVAPCFASDLVC